MLLLFPFHLKLNLFLLEYIVSIFIFWKTIQNEKIVIQGFLWSDSIIRIFVKHLGNNIFGFLWESSKGKFIHIWLYFFYIIKNGLSILWSKWKYLTYHGIKYYSSWPHVNMIFISSFVQYFWCNVSRCTTTFHHQFIWTNNFRQTKVYNLNLTQFICYGVLFNKNILGFQISMNNSSCLKILNGLNNLIHNESNFMFLKLIIFDVLK